MSLNESWLIIDFIFEEKWWRTVQLQAQDKKNPLFSFPIFLIFFCRKLEINYSVQAFWDICADYLRNILTQFEYVPLLPYWLWQYCRKKMDQLKTKASSVFLEWLLPDEL